MGVPELSLFGVQTFVEMGLDHVLDSYQAGIRLVAVVDDALADILIDVGTVVVGGHSGGAWVGGWSVEGMEVGAESFWRMERLDHGGAGVEGLFFGGGWFARGAVGCWGVG